MCVCMCAHVDVYVYKKFIFYIKYHCKQDSKKQRKETHKEGHQPAQRL